MKKILCLLVLFSVFLSTYSQSFQIECGYPNQFSTFPKTSQDSSDVYSSIGAWFGFSLPLKGSTMEYGKFGGPYCLYSNKWLSESMIKFSHSLSDLDSVSLETAKEIDIKIENEILYQRYTFENYYIELKLSFVSSRAALYTAYLVNTSDKKIKANMNLKGELFPDNGYGEKIENGWIVNFENKEEIIWVLQLNLEKNMQMDYSKTEYSIKFENKQEVNPGDTIKIIASLSQLFSGDQSRELEFAGKLLDNPEEYFNENILRSNYLQKLASSEDSLSQSLALNSLMCMKLNLRSYLPDLQEYRYVRGSDVNSQEVGVDESWMIATSQVAFSLSKSKGHFFYILEALNDNNSLNKFLNKDGKNTPSNVVNDKPMAAWTAWNIYSINENAIFLSLVFDKLEQYHKYWYKHRDVDRNNWCEDVDGIETVALNSMLFIEKKCLRDIAEVLGYQDKVKRYKDEMFEIELDFNNYFLDIETASYQDVHVKTNTKLTSDGGFEYALWSGLIPYELAQYFVGMVESNIKNGNVKKWLKSNNTDFEAFYLLRLGLMSLEREDLAGILKKQIIDEFAERLNQQKLNYYDFDEGRYIINSSYLAALVLMFLYY